jgi:hypothetical protein
MSDDEATTAASTAEDQGSKKRFEVKKVCVCGAAVCDVLIAVVQWNAVALWAWGEFC